MGKEMDPSKVEEPTLDDSEEAQSLETELSASGVDLSSMNEDDVEDFGELELIETEGYAIRHSDGSVFGETLKRGLTFLDAGDLNCLYFSDEKEALEIAKDHKSVEVVPVSITVEFR